MNFHAPATMNFSQMMTKLLNDSNHILSATILMNSNGQMRRSAAEVYWALLMGKHITEFEVQQMLFLPKSFGESTYVPNELPPRHEDLFGSTDDEAEEGVQADANNEDANGPSGSTDPL